MNIQELKQGVVALLTDADGRYLFIRRALTLTRAPGYWCFPGGEVEPGETLEAAIAREVAEEVGFEVTVGAKLIENISPSSEYQLHWLVCQLVENAVKPAIHFNAAEVAEALWLFPREALQLNPMLSTLADWIATELH